ncbi:putative anti-sigma factor [Pusillimonas sp. T7-7]|uniref:ATP-binding protein n=1 Tax=Pusillimonas sp. (strain T7-7) TaxID=1007105 RepID=UPI000208532E|nr:ATP-binding protein [Pusillimonas sp. T7-7]AEC21902.1 putative anti-sigma factor [Pusillimonas sp. T7-7]
MQTIASLSLVPDADAATRALAWLESLAEQQQWPLRTAHKLGLCLDEALTNVMLYGFEGRENDSNKHIQVAVMQEGQKVLIDLIDNGLPFDPTQKKVAPLADTLDEANIGGHGLRLMRHYLQDIQYSRTEQHNYLRMVAVLDSSEPTE